MKNQAPPEPPFRKKQSDKNNDWLKYTAIAYQIVAVMGVGIGAGFLLDKFIPLPFPVFKIVCSFGAVLVVLYLFIKEVSKK
jgi:hypothetical protein